MLIAETLHKAAIDAGIPVISMNSGADVSKELGAIMHVGQPEYDAGKGGGEKTAGLGGSNGVCFNHEPFNTALLDRCQGFADGMGECCLVYSEANCRTTSASSIREGDASGA